MTPATLPPVLRSRPALGLTGMAAEGRFAVQICNDCGAVHYPAQEICAACLGDALRWQNVAPKGVVIARTEVYQSLEPGFSTRLPLATGLVRHASGVNLLCFLHPGCAPDMPVRLHLRLDRGGAAVPVATPQDDTDLKQEASLAHFSRSVRGRTALITDASHPAAQACARAFRTAGAGKIWLGTPDGSTVAGLADGHPLPLDTARPDDTRRALEGLAGKIDIVVFTPAREPEADARPGDSLAAFAHLSDALAPSLEARGGTWVSVLSAAAFALPPRHAAFGARMAALDALSRGLRARLLATGGHLLVAYPGPLDLHGTAARAGPKLTVERLGQAICTALDQGIEDLFPDPVSQDLRARALAAPKTLERELAQMTDDLWR